MNSLIPPSDPLGIPSPYIIFQLLGWVTLLLHIVFKNFVIGGMIIVTLQEWFFAKNPTAMRANTLIMRIMPFALSLGITMGVAPLLFVQVLFGNVFYSANIVMGGYWMAIIGLVMLVFYMIYIVNALRRDPNRSNFIIKFLCLLITVLLIVVTWIFTNNAVLTEHPHYWKDIYTKSHGVLVSDPGLWPRFWHNLVGAVAVAGLWCAAVGRYRLKFHSEDAELGNLLVSRGLIWATLTAAIQIPVGAWYIFSLGSETIRAFMGNGFLFIGWTVSCVTAIAALVFMAMAAVKPDKSVFVWGAIGTIALTILGMVLGRDLLRIIYLEPYVKLQDLTLRPSNSSLGLFLATFVVGLLVLAYMIRLVWTMPKETGKVE